MSVAVMARIWADPPCGGSQLLVLLALADNADEDRRYAWPSVETLARKTKMSERSVQRALRQLETDSLVRTVRAGGRMEDGSYRTTIYCVLPEGRQSDAAASVRGDKSGRAGVTPVSPKPSGEPSVSGERARARPKPVTYRGKPVPAATVGAAARLLEVWQEATGRTVSARTADGGPSPGLRQVVGALLARPEVTEERWATAIRNTAACPPGFVDGALQLGHVFGERAADHALANTGKPGQSPGSSVQSGRTDSPGRASRDHKIDWGDDDDAEHGRSPEPGRAAGDGG